MASSVLDAEQSNTIFGTQGDDVIQGTDQADYIVGLGGNDRIDSKAGDDQIYAGDGDDIIYQSGSGKQHYDGGPGFDTFAITFPLDYDFTVLVDLNTGFSGVKENSSNSLNDTLAGIENVDFSKALSSVHLIGDDGTNELITGSGDDYINPGDNSYYDSVQSGAGNDTIDLGDLLNGYIHIVYNNLSSAIKFNLDGSTNVTTTNKGPNGSDQFLNMINPLNGGGGGVVGTRYDDVFNIHLTDDQFMSVRGGDGIDQYNFSGDGYIRLDLQNSANAASIKLGTSEINNDGFGNQETINGSVDRIRGTKFDDYFSTVGLSYGVMLQGEDGHDTLVSGIGSDQLFGGKGNDTIIGGSGDDDIQGGSGNDDLTGGSGADRFIFRFALTDDMGDNIIRDFNPNEGDKVVLSDETGEDYEFSALNAQILSDPYGNAVVSTVLGSATFYGWTAAELTDYINGSPEIEAPDPSADTFIVQRGIVGKGSGYDAYIMSKWMIDANATITITDSGDNALQFINGFDVTSSKVAANAMMLTLSNGAVVTVLDAASYDYSVGGNPLEKQTGLSFTYQTFVEDVLGVDMPSGSQISQGGAVTISSYMTFGNNVTVTSGITAFGTNAADKFQLDVSDGGSFKISGFDTSSDSLSLEGLTGVIGDVLAEIDGGSGIGGQAILIQNDPFANETFVNLGIDAEGDVVSLTLLGISEVDWASVALI